MSHRLLLLFLLIASPSAAQTASSLTDRKLPLPTPEQAAWLDMEIGMFIHFAPNTWQDQEYDDLSTPLQKINPVKLDTDQWVRAARCMDAKYIVFVAKHVGGFCMWQTDTTDYGIRNTPWRDGKGDVLKDLVESCRKHDIKLGVYLSPQDRKHGADVGGKCKTADEQAAYTRLYRQQLTEVLTRYGAMVEVWFDGSTVIDVGDILKEHAPKAMIFQGPQATIRWVGNEEGYAPYPAWSTVPLKAAKSGVATAKDGDPQGEAWLPNECDARIRREWFWTTKNASTLKTVKQLMEMYEKSVGRGGVLLLNQTPDTTGLIPEADVKRACEFGEELKKRFGQSVAETKGQGDEIVLELPAPAKIEYVVIMEDIAKGGERIREYTLEVMKDGKYSRVAKGSSVGHKRIEKIKPVQTDRVRLRCTKSAAEPLIRKLAVFIAAD